MREAQFLKQNAEKWKLYEQDALTQNDPDVFADRFIELTDDLAYARTFYPQSNTTRYLNGLASRFHQKIYKNKKERKSRIWSFWQFELPYLFKQYHRQLLYAFLFFAAFCFIGALSAKHDESFVRLVLSDEYVNMTNENIENGDPFGVYKRENPFYMFVMIAFNNIKVSFIGFVLGITFSIGTLYYLFSNGIMLGSFMYMFFQHNLGVKSILVIFIHGTLEISALVIAGCAGFIMGSSILFPGTYSRRESIVRRGRDAMKIVFGLVPVFLVAAFLESFVTRHTEMPLYLSITILAGSLAFIIWYFIIYPIQLHKRIERTAQNEDTEENENFQLWLTKKLNSER